MFDGEFRSLGAPFPRRREGRDEALRPTIIFVFIVIELARALRSVVGERQRHAGQRDAVADRVVDAENRRRAVFVVLDDVDLPQRVIGVERSCGKLADQALQSGLAAAAGKTHAAEVAREVEMRILAPVGAAGDEFDALTKTRMGGEPLAKLALQSVEIDRPPVQVDADDHHQIGRPLHAQPRQIHRRHAFTAIHRLRPFADAAPSRRL